MRSPSARPPARRTRRQRCRVAAPMKLSNAGCAACEIPRAAVASRRILACRTVFPTATRASTSEAGDALVEAIKLSGKTCGRSASASAASARSASCRRITASRCSSREPTRRHQAQARLLAPPHSTVGIYLSMSVERRAGAGGEPLFFLDYFACGKLDHKVAADVIQGHREGSSGSPAARDRRRDGRDAGHVSRGRSMTCGFCVGVVEKDHIIDGRSLCLHVVLGLASSGRTSNGIRSSRASSARST